jgi:hypothetical protein
MKPYPRQFLAATILFWMTKHHRFAIFVAVDAVISSNIAELGRRHF